MQLDLDDEEVRALLNLVVDSVEGDRYQMSPRIRTLRTILTKIGAIGGLEPELAQKLRRSTRPVPKASPPPRVYEPPSKGRYRRR
jgi:hypothetical protein